MAIARDVKGKGREREIERDERVEMGCSIEGEWRKHLPAAR